MAALLFATLYLMWHAGGIAIAVSLLLMLLVIERTIHTEFRMNASDLVIHRGRFVRDKVIPMQSIRQVDRIRRFRVGRHALSSCIVIVCHDGQQTCVTPRDEDEFVRQLIRMKGKS